MQRAPVFAHRKRRFGKPPTFFAFTSDVPNRLASLLEERKKLERELSEAKKKIALGAGGNGHTTTENPVRTVGDVTMLARTVHGIQPKDLRSLVDDGKRQIKSGSSRSLA